jgi:hypothetical protein
MRDTRRLAVVGMPPSDARGRYMPVLHDLEQSVFGGFMKEHEARGDGC